MAYKCHPLHGVDPMYSRTHKWGFECSLFTAGQYKRIYDTTMFSSYAYPDCPDDIRYDNVVRHMIMFFIFDDHLETPYGDIGLGVAEADTLMGQINDLFDKLLGKRHVSARDWKPYMLAALALYEDTIAEFNDEQKSRFVRIWKEWTDAMGVQCRNVTQQTQYDSVEQFYKVRDDVIAAKCLYVLLEYAHNLYVPEAEWTNPRFQLYLKHSTRAVVCANDLYSLDKELMDCGGRVERVFNGVAILSRVASIPLDEAIKRVAAMMKEAEEGILELTEEIAGAEWASADTKEFVKRGQYIVSGNWYVSTILDRYHKFLEPHMFD
ncbi:unnamed protein product [Medioppia subpectinata]|uniref:Terpene synthase n=1 Tax=Medioppia subpectinata TaxID=1979941 RepID=A0A7R9QHN5_9ACAR|nr:unnamed protein product [Medioppia subpectinata]CAG2120984.1 unnamed protein product [Medioppia subpectinata]